ncbi:MAG: flagellar hook-associated protein FlgK [Gemmatimonadetes bacterium]|nr:flagellar hook-associated protein FlgK [Gemmatimonadota bacterium]
MTTLGNILNTARSAITTYQAAIQVVSNNIANASTEGYSRQRPVISAKPSLELSFASFGTGVEMDGVVRHRDALLDGQFRRENAATSHFELREQLLGRVEAVLAEPTDAGISNALDRFFAAYSDLANGPTSGSARGVLRERADALATRFRTIENEIQRISTSLGRELDGVVDQVNDLTEQLADLNRQIVASEADGNQAPGLRDARDRLLDQLSVHAQVQVIERPGGDLGVFVGGVPVVDGSVARTLEVRTVSGALEVGIVGSSTAISGVGGQLGARLDVINTEIPTMIGRLDALAGEVVARVNQIHRAGTNPLGQTAIDFFDPAGTTAATISLSADVTSDADAIAAGSGDGLGAYQAGANDTALAISALRGEQNATLGLTFGAYHSMTATDLGLKVASARENAAAHEALVTRADTHRQSVSGVLTEEEVVSLIEFQQAYTAATRLVSVADEMMQSVLRLV